MNATDNLEDPVLGALRELGGLDVSDARAGRLRARCHKQLEVQTADGHQSPSERRRWRHVVGVLAAVWCVLYLLETIERATAVYWF